MKAAWTRLSSMVLRAGGDTRFMEQRFNNLFLRHHKDADEVILTRTGAPLAAVYFTPAGRHPEDLKRLFAEICRRVDSENTLKGSNTTGGSK